MGVWRFTCATFLLGWQTVAALTTVEAKGLRTHTPVGDTKPESAVVSFGRRTTGHFQSRVRYYADKVSDNMVHIHFSLENASINLEVDSDRNQITIDGNGAVLTTEQKVYLKQLSYSDAEEAITRASAYVSEAPHLHSFDRTVVAWGNTTCLAPGSNYTARWTDSEKVTHSEVVVVNSTAGPSYECIGRCGKGCYTRGPVLKHNDYVFTKNCLNHDLCSYHHHASHGGKDENCGDEFAKAIGDYLLGYRTCTHRISE